MKYTIELTDNQKKQMDFMLDMANKHMGFNRKLEMDIPLPMNETSAYKKGFEDGNKIADKDLKEIQDSTYDVAYNEALKDADHAMTVLENMTEREREEWFEDYASVGEVVRECTMQRIMESTKDYEEKKAEEEIIKGDTVCFKSRPNITFVVWDILDEGDEGIFVYGFNKDGTYSSVNFKNVKKVNVPNCYSEVSQLLDKLRGEEDEKN